MLCEVDEGHKALHLWTPKEKEEDEGAADGITPWDISHGGTEGTTEGGVGAYPCLCDSIQHPRFWARGVWFIMVSHQDNP